MKQIIILERVNLPSDNSYRYCFWAPVPDGRENFYANPGFVSAYKDATQEELALLQAGKIVETVGEAHYKVGTPTDSIEIDLQKKYGEFLSSIKDQNMFVLYGTFYDGSTWTQGGKA